MQWRTLTLLAGCWLQLAYVEADPAADLVAGPNRTAIGIGSVATDVASIMQHEEVVADPVADLVTGPDEAFVVDGMASAANAIPDITAANRTVNGIGSITSDVASIMQLDEADADPVADLVAGHDEEFVAHGQSPAAYAVTPIPNIMVTAKTESVTSIENSKLKKIIRLLKKKLKQKVLKAATEKAALQYLVESAMKNKSKVEQKLMLFAKKSTSVIASLRKSTAHLEAKLNTSEEMAMKKISLVKGLESEVDQLKLIAQENERIAQENERMKAFYSEEMVRLAAEKDSLNASFSELQAAHETLSMQYADPSLQYFLTMKATKVYHHPGIEGAANKTFSYVLPSLRQGQITGKEWFNKTHSAVYSRLKDGGLESYLPAAGGQDWLSALSGLIVYSFLFLPLCCTIQCLFSVHKLVCMLRPCLVFCHLLFAIVAACACIFGAATGTDPLSVAAIHDAAVYLFVQVVMMALLVSYTVLLMVALRRSVGCIDMCYRIVQMGCAANMSAAYYCLVWTPAMTDRIPKVSEAASDLLPPSMLVAYLDVWGPYFVTCIIFTVQFRLEQLSWRRAVTKKRCLGGSASNAQTSTESSIADELRGGEVFAGALSMMGFQGNEDEKKD